MKNIIFILSCLIFFVGCKEDDRYSSGNCGLVRLNLALDDKVTVASRGNIGIDESNALKSNSKVRIYKNDKLVAKYKGITDEGVVLPLGDGYSTLIIAGDSVPASFDKRYFKGTQTFSVERKDMNDVNVECRMANTLVDIVFDESWSSYISEGKVDVVVDGVSGEEGKLSYIFGGELKTGYFSVMKEKPVLHFLFSGKSLSGKPFSNKEYVLSDVKESTKYTLTYVPKEGEPIEGNEGGAFFEIQINENPLYEVNDEVAVYQRPIIKAVNGNEEIDFSKDLFVETGSTISPIFTFSGSTALSSVVIESEILPDLGFEKTSVDVISERQSLVDKGFGVELSADGKRVVLAWNNRLDDFLKQDGIINIKYLVTDTYDNIAEGNVAKSRELACRINVSNSNVTAVEIPNRYDIWSYKATLYGVNIEGKIPTGNVYFKYCPKENGQWSELLEATLKEGYYKSEITGLKPGKTYQYQIFEDEKPSGVICEFTTDTPVQLPNAGFEQWQGSKPMLIYSGDASNMFWDSGNHGSSSFSLTAVDLTTYDSSIKVEGNYSAKLESKSIFGVFAAGNIFVGKFLKVDGTDGVLGWGRPWETRPKSLKLFVKYVPKEISGDLDRFPNGNDIGKVYIALGDWTGATYDKNWPVVIQTKYPEKELFNPEPGSYTGDGIIGYGEKEFNQLTAGVNGEMLEFEIPIIYRYVDRIPKSIIIVATASKYGDYYVGSVGSTMWLDDLELVYE